MRQSALKFRPLSLVAPASKRANATREDSSVSLESYFEGWLESVIPTLTVTEITDGKSSRRNFVQLPLTANDVIRVNRSTVRESAAHRHWPREVVLKFLAAEVITNK